MNLNSINIILAQAGAATGQTAGGTTQDPRAEMIKFVGMIVIFGAMMYFLMIRPQNKRAKEHEAMLKTLKAGDKVVTNSGIIGVVIAVKERSVTLRSGDTKLEVLKSAMATVEHGESSES